MSFSLRLIIGGIVLVVMPGLASSGEVEVTEVKGTYCKLATSKELTIKKGDRAQLKRSDEVIGNVLITAITPKFWVGKVSSATPKVGDIVVFTESADKTTTKTAGQKSSVKRKPRKTRKERLAESEAEQEKLREEADKQFLAECIANGERPWPDVSEQQHKDSLAHWGEVVAKVQKTYPGMKRYETERFIVCSNLPTQQVGPYIRKLDTMQAMMCKLYGMSPNERIWVSKHFVFLFLSEDDFIDFEHTFMSMNVVKGSKQAICRGEPTGDVVTACWFGEKGVSPLTNRQMHDRFAFTLVHETSHGFMHRYKTPVSLPNWVNEGLADWTAHTIVPGNLTGNMLYQAGMDMLRTQKSFGGSSFWEGDGTGVLRISTPQYGAATSITDFMIKSNGKAYVDFIKGLKKGLTWQASLQESYRVTPQELVKAYGKSIGIPDLIP